jgi:hypothetical protein
MLEWNLQFVCAPVNLSLSTPDRESAHVSSQQQLSKLLLIGPIRIVRDLIGPLLYYTCCDLSTTERALSTAPRWLDRAYPAFQLVDASWLLNTMCRVELGIVCGPTPVVSCIMHPAICRRRRPAMLPIRAGSSGWERRPSNREKHIWKIQVPPSGFSGQRPLLVADPPRPVASSPSSVQFYCGPERNLVQFPRSNFPILSLSQRY